MAWNEDTLAGAAEENNPYIRFNNISRCLCPLLSLSLSLLHLSCSARSSSNSIMQSFSSTHVVILNSHFSVQVPLYYFYHLTLSFPLPSVTSHALSSALSSPSQHPFTLHGLHSNFHSHIFLPSSILQAFSSFLKLDSDSALLPLSSSFLTSSLPVFSLHLAALPIPHPFRPFSIFSPRPLFNYTSISQYLFLSVLFDIFFLYSLLEAP